MSDKYRNEAPFILLTLLQILCRLIKKHCWPSPFMSERVIAIDIETTGLFPERGDRIIEIGAVILDGGQVTKEFHSLIDVKRRISKTAQKVHGIDNTMLTGQLTSEETMRRFSAFISRCTLVAHNASFDVRFLRYEFSRAGLNLTNQYACTLKMSRRILPDLPDHKLETIYRHFAGCHSENIRTHRALDDARLVATVWMRLDSMKNLATI